MSLLDNWLQQLLHNSLSPDGFLLSAQDALATGQLKPADLQNWLQTAAAHALQSPVRMKLEELCERARRADPRAARVRAPVSAAAAPASPGQNGNQNGNHNASHSARRGADFNIGDVIQGRIGLVPQLDAARPARVEPPAPAAAAPAAPPRRAAAPAPASPAPAAAAAPAARNGDFDVGDVVDGRYELVSLLGGGGMGDVFKALDRLAHEQRDPDPYVAVKILKAKWQTSQKAVLALQREAHRARRLTHSNILRVHQFEQDRRTGQYFLVMELLKGRSVESMIFETSTGDTWAHIAPLISQICAGLSYAHEQGIIHSDIKPSNLFLTKRGEIKILDFGIAAPMPNLTGHETLMDARKWGARTPAYASLETYLGLEPHYSDDVFSLAVVIYEWLTGRHPYTRAKDPGTPVPAPAALKLELQPTPVPGLSRDQNRAILRALALRRAERTQTIEEFWESMGGGETARGSIANIPVKSSRALVTVLIVVAAAIAAVIAVAVLMQSDGPSPAADVVGKITRDPPASCPDSDSPGALQTAVVQASDARDLLDDLAEGSPEWRQARERLSKQAQCLHKLAVEGLTDDRSAELLKDIDTKLR